MNFFIIHGNLVGIILQEEFCMILQVKNLEPNICCIYKLNYPNGKIYIRYTIDLQRRMHEHNFNSHKKLQPCDAAIKKYGIFTEVEILEFINDPSLLAEKEKYWIKKFNAYEDKNIGYNLTPGGDASGQFGDKNAQAVFSNSQVLDIRKRRYNGERKKDVYKDYSNYSFSTFEKIWLGRGYPNIGKEYIIQTNSKSRSEYSSEANAGTKNGRAKCSKEEVLDIRKRYDNGESIANICKIYTKISKSTIRRIALRESYNSIK